MKSPITMEGRTLAGDKYHPVKAEYGETRTFGLARGKTRRETGWLYIWNTLYLCVQFLPRKPMPNVKNVSRALPTSSISRVKTCVK